MVVWLGRPKMRCVLLRVLAALAIAGSANPEPPTASGRLPPMILPTR